MVDEMSSCREMIMVPQELVTEILSCLPVKSLLRFKCTCSSWYHLINSPFFVNLHLTTAAALKIEENNNYTIFTESTNPVSYPDPYVNVAPPRFSLVSGDTFHVIREVMLPCFREFGFRACGPCNGLFCLIGLNYNHQSPNYPFSDDIALWNPATRKLNILPGSPFPTRKYSVIGFGFGFDAAAISSDSDSDYNVVKIVRVYVEGKAYFHAYVYSLKKNCWREVSGPPPAAEVSLVSRECCAYHNGAYHWLSLHYNTILSFDMHTHVFHVSSLPLVGLGGHWMANFAVQNDSLAIVVYSMEETNRLYNCRYYWGQTVLSWYEILVRNEVSKTWSTQAKVDDYPFMHTRFCVNGTAIGHDGYHLVSYNPKTQELKKIEVYGCGWFFTIIAFRESLVSVNGGDEGEAIYQYL